MSESSDLPQPRPRHASNAATRRRNEKAEAIIVEARRQLLEKGLSGFSVRAVARALDLRLFNVQHYFPSTEALLHAALKDAIATFDAEINQFLSEQHASGPREALRESCLHFLRMNKLRSVRFFFFEMAAAAQRDSSIEGMLQNLYREYLSRIRALVKSTNPALAAEELYKRVELMASFIEGTMLVLPSNGNEGHDSASEEMRLDFLVEIACRKKDATRAPT